MENITDAILFETIARLPEVFDSHAVIRGIMRWFPAAYVRDLYANLHRADPILTLHATIGQRLAQLPDLVATRRVKSLNCRGERTENQQWRRRRNADVATYR